MARSALLSLCAVFIALAGCGGGGGSPAGLGSSTNFGITEQPVGLETAAPGSPNISVGPTEGTHYVSPNGDDGNSGSAASPWKTLQRAAAAIKPGSTVVIADGEYPGGVKIASSGTSAAPIIFRAQNPGRVIVHGDETSAVDAVLVTKADWVVIDGLAVTRGKRGIRVDQSNHVTVRRCRCYDNEVQGIFSNYSDDLIVEYNECVGTRVQHGIYVSNGGDRPIVRFNTCRDNARCGIQLNGDGKMVRADIGARGDGIIEGAVVANNVVSNCGLDASNRGAAINLASVRGSVIAGNLLFNNLGSGIALFNDNAPGAVQWGSKDNQIIQNTVYFRAGEGRWCVSMKNGSTGNRVLNNVLVGGRSGALEFDGRSGFASDGNLCFSYAGAAIATKADAAAFFTLEEWRTTSSNDQHSATADPGFGSPANAAAFRPRSGSPAIGLGVPIAIPFTDLDGRPFGANGRWSAGCFSGG
jgi:parallel beta-helix repeat protein